MNETMEVFSSVHLHKQLKPNYTPYEILLRGNCWKSRPGSTGENSIIRFMNIFYYLMYLNFGMSKVGQALFFT